MKKALAYNLEPTTEVGALARPQNVHRLDKPTGVRAAGPHRGTGRGARGARARGARPGTGRRPRRSRRRRRMKKRTPWRQPSAIFKTKTSLRVALGRPVDGRRLGRRFDARERSLVSVGACANAEAPRVVPVAGREGEVSFSQRMTETGAFDDFFTNSPAPASAATKARAKKSSRPRVDQSSVRG